MEYKYEYKPTKALYKIAETIRKSRELSIIKGGAGAGKTIGIEMLILDLFNRKPDLQITICSKERTKLMDTAFHDFKKIALDWGLWYNGKWNENKSKFTFNHGRTGFIEFIGLDKSDIGKGRRRDLIYINEVNKITHDKFVDITLRSKSTVVDYNPDAPFWIDDYITDQNYLVVTHEDNQYLPEEERQNIYEYANKGFFNPKLTSRELFDESNIKNKYFANKYRVYGLGLDGQIDGVIFQDWERGKFDDTLPYCYGLDWGIVHPFTVVKVAVDDKKKKVYLKQLIYKSGLNTNQIIELLKNKLTKEDLLICDSEDRRGVNDLIVAGFNARSAYKPNVISRIRQLMAYTILVDDSSDIENELKNYIWLDKKGEVPIKEFDHALDAAGYAFVFLMRYLF